MGVTKTITGSSSDEFGSSMGGAIPAAGPSVGPRAGSGTALKGNEKCHRSSSYFGQHVPLVWSTAYAPRSM